MAGRQLQLVRHVEWDKFANAPSPNGEAQAAEARARLADILMSTGAVVLSSAANRAMFTGRALVANMDVPLYASKRMELGGLDPTGIRASTPS